MFMLLYLFENIVRLFLFPFEVVSGMISGSVIGVLKEGECVALVSPKTLHYYNTNNEIISSRMIALSRKLGDVKSVVCDPFGHYILFIETAKVYILYLDIHLCSSQDCFDKAVYDVEELKLDHSNSSVIYVQCHPRIPDCFYVLLNDGSLLQYNPFIQKKATSDVSLLLSQHPAVHPLSFSFGCENGNDQFALYISYSNGMIGMINHLPVSGYSLSKESFSKLYRNSNQSTREWLNTWSVGECMYQESCPVSEIVIVNHNEKRENVSSSELIIEHLGEDIILIEQIVNQSIINLYIRSVYQEITSVPIRLIAHFSTESLHVKQILKDLSPFSFILISDTDVYSLTLSWLSSFLRDKKILPPKVTSFYHHHNPALSSNTVVSVSRYHGHCLFHLDQQTGLKVLRVIKIVKDKQLHLKQSLKDTPLNLSKELSQEMEVLQTLQTTDTFQQYLKQLNMFSFSDPSIDNGVTVDIINQYQLPIIKQMGRIKQAIIQTTKQIHVAIEKAEIACEDLQHKTNHINEKNEELRSQLKEILKKQDLLDTHFNRVLQKIQAMIHCDDQKDTKMIEQIALMMKVLQDTQLRLQQAVHAVTSAEYLIESAKDISIEVPEEKEEVDPDDIKSLETVQKKLISASNLRKEVSSLTKEYEEIKQKNDIRRVVNS